MFIWADMVLDGGDASLDSGYGGRPVLNPWRGEVQRNLQASVERSGYCGNWGIGANTIR